MTEIIRVFLADDDEDDRDFFSLALKKVNSRALLTVASNGAEALEYFKKRNPAPHFIFLDINMPRVNGIDCLKQIRQVYPAATVPVIMLSTSRSSQMVELSFTNGASFYVQKPNHIGDLAEQLKYCLEHLSTPVHGSDNISTS
jgi:CheY-like chemotaxis protein